MVRRNSFGSRPNARSVLKVVDMMKEVPDLDQARLSAALEAMAATPNRQALLSLALRDG